MKGFAMFDLRFAIEKGFACSIKNCKLQIANRKLKYDNTLR